MATRAQTPKALPGGLRDVATAHPWSYAASLLLVAVAYYAAAKLGLRLALVGRNITPFWPPTGIAVVAFILLGRSMWPGVALAAFAVNLPISTNGLAAAATAAGNTLAPLVAATLLSRVGFHRQIDRLRDATAIVFVGALLSMSISASVGTGTLVVPRGSPVRRVLDFTGLPRVIPLEARLEDALAQCDCGLPDTLA
jgi:integral membrane sensor domain MASE1